jgi:hypothetical protein
MGNSTEDAALFHSNRPDKIRKKEHVPKMRRSVDLLPWLG